MPKTATPETATRVSQPKLGLVAVIFAVILWAVAANLISSLFVAGVKPFELAVLSMAIATFGFAVVNNPLLSHFSENNLQPLV